jgi:hypothetical protein
VHLELQSPDFLPQENTFTLNRAGHFFCYAIPRLAVSSGSDPVSADPVSAFTLFMWTFAGS